jgi:hypothetical protein
MTTIEAKLNADCPMFFRLDALFGGRQNVVPSFVMQSTDTQLVMPPPTQFIDLYEDEDEISIVNDVDDFCDEQEVANMLFNMSNGSDYQTGDKREASITHESSKQKNKKVKSAHQITEKTSSYETTTSKIECSNKLAESLAQKIIDNKKSKRDFSSCYVETKSK